MSTSSSTSSTSSTSSSSSTSQRRSIFITGASSGIGHATALAYAEHYSKNLAASHLLTLVLTARRIRNLELVRDDIVKTFPDVTVE
ncbi:hypothetical protein HDU67_001397, partial [Dinochytrium kinnereticum]